MVISVFIADILQKPTSIRFVELFIKEDLGQTSAALVFEFPFSFFLNFWRAQ